MQTARAASYQLSPYNQFLARLSWRHSFIQDFESHWKAFPSRTAAHGHATTAGHGNGTPEYEERFARWRAGQTGIPILDATMRCLHEMGWTTFRLRQTTASFGMDLLGLDWRDLGIALGQLFADYTPGIHWPQITIQAGVAAPERGPRIVNPIKQSVELDPDEVFLRRWLPELEAVPAGFGHEAWRHSAWRGPAPLLTSRPPCAAPARNGRRVRPLTCQQSSRHSSDVMHPINVFGSRTSATEGRSNTAMGPLVFRNRGLRTADLLVAALSPHLRSSTSSPAGQKTGDQAMSRITTLPSIDAAPEGSKEILGAIAKGAGRLPNIFAIMGNSPAALKAATEFDKTLSSGEIDRATRERIALTVGERNHCTYCLSAHSFIARNLAKLDDAEIYAARQGRSADLKADAAVRFAASLVDNRGRVSAEEVEAVRGAGWSDGAVVEIIAIVGYNTFTNYLNEALGTEVDFPVVSKLAA